MYIGIDHGTTAMRFAGDTSTFKIPRKEAVNFKISDLSRLCPIDEIEGIAITYSMGDNFSEIMPIECLKNRGLVSEEGAGSKTGGGTHVFDEVLNSGIPAIAIPGLHRGSPTDPRFKVYSHQASPEKIGIAYSASEKLGQTCIISDISSNTVSLLVKDDKIIGGFDACCFAPGKIHGALDLDAIRLVDANEKTATEAFLNAGVSTNLPPDVQLPAIAMFAAMECASLLLLANDAPIALAGSLANNTGEEISRLLNRPVLVMDEWAASKGLQKIAFAVFSKKVNSILGIKVLI